MAERLNSRLFLGKCLMGAATASSHWVRPARESLALTSAGIEHSAASGDLLTVTFHRMAEIWVHYFIGTPLELRTDAEQAATGPFVSAPPTYDTTAIMSSPVSLTVFFNTRP